MQYLHSYGVQKLHSIDRQILPAGLLSENFSRRGKSNFCTPAKRQVLHSGEKVKTALSRTCKNCIHARMQKLHAGDGKIGDERKGMFNTAHRICSIIFYPFQHIICAHYLIESTFPPVIFINSAGDNGKTAFGLPPAAQIWSYFSKSSSMMVSSAPVWQVGGTPPTEKPVAA